MMSQIWLLSIVFAFAIGHGTFLAATLLIGFNTKVNRLLSLILVVLIVRVGKSILTILFPEWSYLASSIGLIAMTALGPLLLFYIESLFTAFELDRKKSIHLVALVFSVAVCLSANWRVLNLAYYIFTFYLFVYIFWISYSLYKNATEYRTDDVKWKWSLGIIGGISVIFITFVLQLFVYNRFIYTIIVVASALVLYLLSLWAVRQHKLFLPVNRKKIKNSYELGELSNRILRLFQKDEIFVDASLSITKLAKQLHTQPYLVSKTINSHFKKSFSEFLMEFRIIKAEQLLLSSINQTLTVEAIAYESGFSTLSAFYTSFKKINNMTPNQFRKAGGRADMKVG